MRKTAFGSMLILFVILAAERKPGSAIYVSHDDIQETLKRAPENAVSDQQIRVVDVGKVNVGVGAVSRPAGTRQTSIEHDQVTEVYTILEGSGTMVSGGKMSNPERLKPEDATVRVLVGPSMRGGALENGESRRVGPGDVIIIPAGVPHWFSAIDGNIRYSVVRIDPDKRLPAK